MSEIATDDKGFPVLLADVPSAGVSNVAAGQRSGNKRHDVRSGKFGAGGGGGGKRPQAGAKAPRGADPVEWGRYQDAVRQASREVHNPTTADIQEFINAHAKDPGSVDVNEFLAAVQEQRIADMVDLIDHALRRDGGSLATGKRKVRIQAPKGYLKQLLNVTQPQQIAEVSHRLESLGHSPEEVDTYIKGRVKTKNHSAIDDAKTQIQASDVWEGVPPEDYVELSDEDEASDLLDRIVLQPVIHVHVDRAQLDSDDA